MADALHCSQEADIALGPFGIKLSRSKVVDFTDSLYFDDRAILSKKGEPEIDPWGFLYPLTESVWATMAAVLAVVWLVMVGIGQRPKGATPLGWSGELLLENIRVFLNQGKLELLNYFHVSSALSCND